MKPNVQVLRQAYCFFTDTRYDPSLRLGAEIPPKGYNFSILNHDGLRVELVIGVPEWGKCIHSAQLRVFQPGEGPGSWPGKILAVCDAVDDPDRDVLADVFYAGSNDPDRALLCQRLREDIGAAVARARSLLVV